MNTEIKNKLVVGMIVHDKDIDHTITTLEENSFRMYDGKDLDSVKVPYSYNELDLKDNKVYLK